MDITNIFDKFSGIKRSDFVECIGIHISLTDVYVAQVTTVAGGMEVNSLIKLPMTEVPQDVLKPADLNDEFFATTKHWLDPIQKIIENREFNTKNVVVSLDPAFCIHRHFVVQNIARSYWKQTIPLQARKYIHYPFEKGVYDFYVYPFNAPLSKTQKLGVVFCMTSSKIVSALEAGMKKIGLNLVSVECSVLSTYRLLTQIDKENSENKGIIYSNFTSNQGQFLFALNGVPLMFREVEVQKALGARNRLEITNCMDFISKQLEKNPFEDAAVVSDDGEFWVYIVEGEVKQHVRISKISEVFGFRVEGFAEMAVLGACLKFVNKKVPDIDFYKKNRSSDEEIRATTCAWLITGIIACIIIVYALLMQITSVITAAQLKSSKRDKKEVPDFQGLYADQIKTKVANLKSNQKKLENLLVEPYFTKKLSALPRTLPEEIWISSLAINNSFNFEDKKKKTNMIIEGVASSISGSKEELALGDKFKSDIASDPDFSDICKNSTTINYDIDNSLQNKGNVFVLGTRFTVKCGVGK
ncbi:MAG: hypothetical protein J5594_02005 [Elusimicrobiaceae bacterium]|nr:hypothetical protein [Elusimicrobiaceae bacterium]